MKLGSTLLAIALLSPSSAPLAEGAEGQDGRCTRSAVGSGAIAMRSARAELMAEPLEDDGTLVPPATGRRIEAVKDRVRLFVRAMMSCAPSTVDPAALAAAMAQRGDSPAETASGNPERPSDDRHGDRLAYEVSRVDGRPDMLAVVATLAIRCGSDSMLILYRRTAAGWREVMVRRAQPYTEVRGGWQDMRFSVSPDDSRGGWFVATVSTTPWCSSSWQGLRYALARPAEDPARPKVFLDEKTVTWLGGEEALVVLAERDSFELRHVAASLDPGVHNRRHVRRYTVAGETVRRVQPVAESVRDFVDEWIVSPWEEAKHWSGKDAGIARTHAELHPDHHELLDEFESIRTCGAGLTQVEIGAGDKPSWFFLVRGTGDGPWILETVARRPAAGCTGPDSLAH